MLYGKQVDKLKCQTPRKYYQPIAMLEVGIIFEGLSFHYVMQCNVQYLTCLIFFGAEARSHLWSLKTNAAAVRLELRLERIDAWCVACGRQFQTVGAARENRRDAVAVCDGTLTSWCAQRSICRQER